MIFYEKASEHGQLLSNHFLWNIIEQYFFECTSWLFIQPLSIDYVDYGGDPVSDLCSETPALNNNNNNNTIIIWKSVQTHEFHLVLVYWLVYTMRQRQEHLGLHYGRAKLLLLLLLLFATQHSTSANVCTHTSQWRNSKTTAVRFHTLMWYFSALFTIAARPKIVALNRQTVSAQCRKRQTQNVSFTCHWLLLKSSNSIYWDICGIFMHEMLRRVHTGAECVRMERSAWFPLLASMALDASYCLVDGDACPSKL